MSEFVVILTMLLVTPSGGGEQVRARGPYATLSDCRRDSSYRATGARRAARRLSERDGVDLLDVHVSGECVPRDGLSLSELRRPWDLRQLR